MDEKAQNSRESVIVCWFNVKNWHSEINTRRIVLEKYLFIVYIGTVKFSFTSNR